MAIIDNTLAAQVPTFDPATPLAQAAKIQGMQAEAQAAQFKQAQTEIGSEARGLQVYVNTPEFPAKWAETADRLRNKGLLDERTHQQWRNQPSPLLLKQMIAQTSDPTLDFRKQEAQREQGNLDRQFSFQQDQAREKPTIQRIKDANGEERLVMVTPQGKVTKLDTGEPSPTNPYSNGKQNESQAKDSLYASRMFQSEKILREVETAGSDPEQRIKAKIPLVGNYLVSGDYQKFDQAQRDFINATLRRESGAVIADSEFANANKQYFPQPGDSKDVIAQKRRNRAEAIKGIAAGGGANYSPPYTFGANDELVPNEGKKSAASKSTATGPKQITSKADFDALPSGTSFTAPDGSQRVKP